MLKNIADQKISLSLLIKKHYLIICRTYLSIFKVMESRFISFENNIECEFFILKPKKY